MCEKIKYALYRGSLGALALLPLPMLYRVSDLLYLILSKGLKYRRKVIRTNLRNSFPEKSEQELREIEKDFYHQFADNIVETVKLLHLSDREVDRRIKVTGGEIVDRLIEEGHPVVLYLGHYANWEWVPAITRHFKTPEFCAQVYKPLRDKAFDRLMLKVRSRFNPISVPQKQVFRTLIRWRNEGRKFITGFISDHRSNAAVSHHRTTFLNQITPFNPGGEEIGDRMNAAYLYLDVEKTGRGHYHFTFKEIKPKDMEEDSPYTRRYMEMLEETIRRRPGLWLWSHRRWKYQ
ncbi:MAG: lysophospholipid acyltransferase family protein [Duncaniella sp.]|uniref:lysophospholipid acyltransferase family protein n=1 Tax=Duncaniella sp. TaxID=2518496 RepID=UPI0023D6821A|nr:lysophospholipid acyltransferase family protein [Duncaniella sp.]MDE6089744.1 lysophospholipid acyltransferase family protein [Duncaniella sp.]